MGKKYIKVILKPELHRDVMERCRVEGKSGAQLLRELCEAYAAGRLKVTMEPRIEVHAPTGTEG